MKNNNNRKNSPFEYDVALSFAGEDREYVDRVANFIKGKLRVFYDSFEQVDLWGKDLYTHLDEVYRKKALYCVMFNSKHYARKVWTNHERQSAQARAFEEHKEYILPVRLDNTEIPGIRPTVGYIDGSKTSPEQLATMILQKCSFKSAPKTLRKDLPADWNPSVVDWRITSECDYNCPCCFGSKGIHHLDLKHAKDIIDKLYAIKIRAICVSGGEPLRYPYIDDVLSYIHDRGMDIYLSTNGNHFWEHKEIIEKCVSKLSLPLDGYSQEIHARNGRNLNNFTQVISILQHYAKKDKPFQIKVGTLLTSNNITIPNNLTNIFTFLKNYSIDVWKIYEFVPEGKAIHNKNLLGYPEEFFSLTVQSLYKEITVVSPFPIVISRRKDRNRAYFIIQPDGGVVIPEDYGEVVEECYLGSILIDSLENIVEKWKNKVDFTNYQRNVRIIKEEEYPVVLDLLDRNILTEFSKDPTQTHESIGKILSVRADIIDNRIKLLHDRGILKNVIPILDVDRLGFYIFNVFLSVETADDESHQRILNYLLNHPFIPWVARCSGKWTFVIAIFANNLRHYREIMMDIEKACEKRLEFYESLPIYEKYILGQRYLFHDEKISNLKIDDTCRISLDKRPVVPLTNKDFETLAKITGYNQPSIFDFSKKYGEKYKEIADDIEKLRRIGILKKFLPTCDISLLGYEWYIVLIRFRDLTEEKRKEFIEYISLYPQITHIICCIGNWDINFEIHVKDNKKFRDIYQQIKNKFIDIIVQEDNVTILKEHKFNFLVDSFFERRPEVK